MEAAIEEVIRDINMSLPERKLNQLLERTSLSADVKAIMSDIMHLTIKVGGKVLAIGRKILTFVLDLVKTFPAIAMGTIAALVITAVVGSVPIIGAPLAAFVGPILLAIGVTAGALKDFTNDKLQDRITNLVESFKVLVEL
jgi:hypothetical protein